MTKTKEKSISENSSLTSATRSIYDDLQQQQDLLYDIIKKQQEEFRQNNYIIDKNFSAIKDRLEYNEEEFNRLIYHNDRAHFDLHQRIYELRSKQEELERSNKGLWFGIIILSLAVLVLGYLYL